jgi:hypothetical protein
MNCLRPADSSLRPASEADPLLCPRCQKEMRIVALIDDQSVIERILRHLGLWPACRDARGAGRQQAVRVEPGPDPPGDWVIEACFEDALPDYDTTPDLAYANE